MSAVLASVETYEPALFRDAESALRFLFRIEYENYERSLLADLASGPRPNGRGLAGLDGAGNAGIIGAQLATLPQLWRRILTVRSLVRQTRCECGRSCCSGVKTNPRWLVEVAWISETVFLDLQLPLLREKRRVREALVCLYFRSGNVAARLLGIDAGKVNFQKVADVAGIHRNTLSDYNSQLCTILGREEKQAWSSIEERMQSAGIVGHA